MPNVIQKNQNYGITPNFDKALIALWKKGAPHYYSQFKYDNGTSVNVRYHDTIVLKREGAGATVQYNTKEQIRALEVVEANVPPLIKSFENGIDYTLPPPSVEKVGKWHDGRTGFTRHPAFSGLGWSYYYYDVISFGSAKDRTVYMILTNRKQPEDIRTFNTTTDIYKNVCQMIDDGLIEKKESDITLMVNTLLTHGSDDDRLSMVCDLLSYSGILHGHYRTYHSRKGKGSTQAWAETHGYPYGGDKNKNVPEVGYILHSPTALGGILMMLKQSYDSSVIQGTRVLCEARAYIKGVKPNEIDLQRNIFEIRRTETWKLVEKIILNCVSIITDSAGKPKIKVSLPLLWKGFADQKKQKDPSNGGNFLEEDGICIDISGKPFTV